MPPPKKKQQTNILKYLSKNLVFHKRTALDAIKRQLTVFWQSNSRKSFLSSSNTTGKNACAGRRAWVVNIRLKLKSDVTNVCSLKKKKPFLTLHDVTIVWL